MKRHIIGIAASLGAASFGAHAADTSFGLPVQDEALSQVRGGFDLGGNLVASFALERTVLVNGAEALRTTVAVPDVARMTQEQAQSLSDALRTTVVSTVPASTDTVSSVGAPASSSPALPTLPVPNVAVSSLPGGSGPGLVLQNALDNQSILATTRIDAAVNTGALLQNLRLDEQVRDATIQFRGY
jgi:hypothetical protein